MTEIHFIPLLRQNIIVRNVYSAFIINDNLRNASVYRAKKVCTHKDDAFDNIDGAIMVVV